MSGKRSAPWVVALLVIGIPCLPATSHAGSPDGEKETPTSDCDTWAKEIKSRIAGQSLHDGVDEIFTQLDLSPWPHCGTLLARLRYFGLLRQQELVIEDRSRTLKRRCGGTWAFSAKALENLSGEMREACAILRLELLEKVRVYLGNLGAPETDNETLMNAFVKLAQESGEGLDAEVIEFGVQMSGISKIIRDESSRKALVAFLEANPQFQDSPKLVMLLRRAWSPETLERIARHLLSNPDLWRQLKGSPGLAKLGTNLGAKRSLDHAVRQQEIVHVGLHVPQGTLGEPNSDPDRVMLRASLEEALVELTPLESVLGKDNHPCRSQSDVCLEARLVPEPEDERGAVRAILSVHLRAGSSDTQQTIQLDLKTASLKPPTGSNLALWRREIHSMVLDFASRLEIAVRSRRHWMGTVLLSPTVQLARAQIIEEEPHRLSTADLAKGITVDYVPPTHGGAKLQARIHWEIQQYREVMQAPTMATEPVASSDDRNLLTAVWDPKDRGGSLRLELLSDDRQRSRKIQVRVLGDPVEDPGMLAIRGIQALNAYYNARLGSCRRPPPATPRRYPDDPSSLWSLALAGSPLLMDDDDENDTAGTIFALTDSVLVASAIAALGASVYHRNQYAAGSDGGSLDNANLELNVGIAAAAGVVATRALSLLWD